MARARAAQTEGMAWEKATLLATAHDEVAGATQRVSVLGDQLVTARQAMDVAEAMILILTSEVATANQQQEVTQKQCERLVHKLTLLSIRDSKLCITITGAPLLTPLNERMRLTMA
jgi:transcriptional regulator of nitric oxide reductase